MNRAQGSVPAMRRGLLVLALLWCCRLLPDFLGGFGEEEKKGPPAKGEPERVEEQELDWKDLAYQRQLERTFLDCMAVISLLCFIVFPFVYLFLLNLACKHTVVDVRRKMLQDRSWLLAPPVGRWLGLVPMHQLRDELVRAVNRWQCQLRYRKPKEEGPAQLQGPNIARVPTLSIIRAGACSQGCKGCSGYAHGDWLR